MEFVNQGQNYLGQKHSEGNSFRDCSIHRQRARNNPTLISKNYQRLMSWRGKIDHNQKNSAVETDDDGLSKNDSSQQGSYEVVGSMNRCTDGVDADGKIHCWTTMRHVHRAPNNDRRDIFHPRRRKDAAINAPSHSALMA